jgi:acylphosphatase
MVTARTNTGKSLFHVLAIVPALIAIVLVLAGAFHGVSASPAEKSVDSARDPVEAVQGLVSGKVQQVGFRAAIFRLAIRYNLAGWDENLSDGTVRFLLQGPRSRIENVLALIPQADRKGNVAGISTQKVPVLPTLQTFTVRDWTSKSRGYANPTDLVFTLRSPDGPVSKKEATRTYHRILKEATGLVPDSSF